LLAKKNMGYHKMHPVDIIMVGNIFMMGYLDFPSRKKMLDQKILPQHLAWLMENGLMLST